MNCRVLKAPHHKKAFTEKLPPEGARCPETERLCAGRVFSRRARANTWRGWLCSLVPSSHPSATLNAKLCSPLSSALTSFYLGQNKVDLCVCLDDTIFFPVAAQQAKVIYGHVCGPAGPSEACPSPLNGLSLLTTAQWKRRKSYKSLNIP